MIDIFLNSPYPATESIYSHELNAEGGKTLRIAFWKDDSTPYDLDNKTVTAAFVTNNTLISDNVAATDKSGNEFTLDISSNSNYTIIPGNMLVEFEIKEGNKVLTPATAMIVHVRGSIKNNAQVTPESYGTVSEILQEVANARGTYNSLGARLDDIQEDIDDIEEEIDNILPIGENDIADGAVTSGKIRTGEVKTANIDTGAVESDKIGNGEVKTINIDDGSVTYNKLAPDALNYIESKLPYSRIVKDVGGVAAGVDITYLNTLIFDRKTIYYVWFATNALFSGSPREWCIFFEIEAGCQIAIRPNGDIYYREYSNSQWSDFKIKAQDDYSNNAADYSLGFDSNGVVKASANVTGLTTGISGCNIVYTAPKCTTLTSAFKSVNPDLVEIYVDNYAEAMTIDSSILNDSNITIYYRGEFKLVDLLSNSQFRLNTRQKALEPKTATITSGSTIALADNTEYTGTNISAVTFTYPQSGSFECYIKLTFASSGNITVTFPSSSYIGSVPIFANNETWEISIKNGVIVAGKATSGI